LLLEPFLEVLGIFSIYLKDTEGFAFTLPPEKLFLFCFCFLQINGYGVLQIWWFYRSGFIQGFITLK